MKDIEIVIFQRGTKLCVDGKVPIELKEAFERACLNPDDDAIQIFPCYGMKLKFTGLHGSTIILEGK